MVTEVSLPHSQVPATCPYSVPIDPVHVPKSHFLKIQSTPRSSKFSLSRRPPHRNPVYPSPLPHTCQKIGLSFLFFTALQILYKADNRNFIIFFFVQALEFRIYAMELPNSNLAQKSVYSVFGFLLLFFFAIFFMKTQH